MLLIIQFLFFSFILKTIKSEPNFGNCGKIGYTAKNFDSCKGQSTYDTTKYCCFLQSGKYRECVEILKKDVDNDAIDMTIKEIEKGIYEGWENNNGIDLNKFYDDIDSLECDKSSFINIYYIFFLFYFFLML